MKCPPLLRLLSAVPLEGAVVILSLAMLFAGLCIQFGLGWALIGTGATVLTLETWSSLISTRKR